MNANKTTVLKTDLDLTTKDLSGLTSADALAAFLARLGYDTCGRTVLTPSSLGLSGDTASSIRSMELLSEDDDKFLRVLFVQPKSLTAKVRNELIRVLGKSNEDYLVILAATFETLEFVLLDKRTKEQAGPAGGYKVQIVPKVFSIDRRKPSRRTYGRSASLPGHTRTPSTSSTSFVSSSTTPSLLASFSRIAGSFLTTFSANASRRMPSGVTTPLAPSSKFGISTRTRTIAGTTRPVRTSSPSF